MFKEYFNHASQLIYIISAEGVIIEVNDAVAGLTGIEKSDIIGCEFWELSCWVHSEMMQNRVLFSIEACAVTMENSRFSAQYKDYKNDIVDVDFVIKPVFDDDDMVDYFVGLGYNVTELVSARKALSDQQRQMSALFERANEGFIFNMLPEDIERNIYTQDELINVIVKHQKLDRWNNSFKNIFAITDEDIKDNPNALAQLKIDPTEYADAISNMLEDGEFTHEYSFINRSGHKKIVCITFSSIEKDDQYYGNFCVVNDITLTRQYENKLKRLASTDFLTGLNNRRTFFSLAEKEFENQSVSVIAMLDIDKFKSVNDTYGHDTGDIVLKNFSQLLCTHFDKYGITSRLGGEEFAVLITNIKSDEAIALFDKFRIDLFKFEHQVNENETIRVSVSTGICILDNDSAIDVDECLKKADLSLYKAKQTGRNKVVVYDENDTDER